MHALYFLGYAFMATTAAIIIAQAQYSRKKNEGTPINLGFFKAAAAVAMFMWTAAGVTTVAYA
mgnify:CR=1 FL=1